MRRSSIVVTATAAAAAGILAFHAHAPAVQPATAAAAPTSTRSASKSTAASSGSGSGSSASANGLGHRHGRRGRDAYGDSQVRVTVKNGKLVRIEALQLPGNDPRSVEIASCSQPILQQEALTAQSAAVDAVSGATYTSASYTRMLQSALDKLGFQAADGSRATLQVP